MYPQNNSYYARAQVPSNNILWVQGVEGAKAQQILPGNTLLLLDSEQDRFYIKSCDQYGICLPLKTYKFEEVIEVAQPQLTVEAAAAPDLSNYVTKEELEQLIKELKQSNEQSVPTAKYITSASTTK